MYRKPVLILLFCCITSVAISAQSLEAPKSLLPPNLYIIQPNDLLAIFVWKEPNLSGKVTVRPDGRISFPLIQDMQAAGLNPGQLKNRIEESLKEYIEVPGKVSKPGMLMSEKPISVLQAISMAGGFSEFANPSETVIIRNTGEDSTLYKFNYPEVIKGRNFSQNMLLRSGDVVVVP